MVFINAMVFVALATAVELGFYGYRKLSGASEPPVPISLQLKYETDQFGFRKVTNAKPESRTRALVLAGCSMIFGHGLKDQADTIPQMVADAADGYFVSNLSTPGGGMHTVLAHVLSGDFEEATGIKERASKPLFVYFHYTWHVERAVGSSQINEWRRGLPYFEISADGKVISKESFALARPLTTLLYEVISSSNTARFFNFSWPAKITDAHREYSFRLIKEIRDVFKQKTGSDDFYVVNLSADDRTDETLRQAMAKWGIRYLDYQHLFEVDNPEYWIPNDGHSTRVLNEIIANQLLKDLAISRKASET